MHPTTTFTAVRWFAVLVFVLGLTAVGCSGPQIPFEPMPMPAGVKYTGKWYSPQYENMELSQKGGTVSGTFSYKDGGTVKGDLDGNILVFEWVQEGDFNKAVRGASGRGYFAISDDGKTLTGEWGYGEELVGGGSWTAERLAEREGQRFDPNEAVFGN